MVYTKIIIHLSVGESGGYLPPLWWIIVNYNKNNCPNHTCISHTLTTYTECYVTAESSSGNYSVRSVDLFLLRDLLCHCFSWTKSPQFGNKMLHFSLSIKDMNLLDRLVWYLYFQCHFMSGRRFSSEQPEIIASCRLLNDSPLCYGPHPTSHVVVRFIPCLYFSPLAICASYGKFRFLE